MGLRPFRKSPTTKSIDGVPDKLKHWTKKDFEKLRELPKDKLERLGFRRWSKGSGLMCFPDRWYDYIPEGFEVTKISGVTKPFDPEEFCREWRYGAQSFGVKIDSEE